MNTWVREFKEKREGAHIYTRVHKLGWLQIAFSLVLKRKQKSQEEARFSLGLVAENEQNLEYKCGVLRADIQDTEDKRCSELLLFGDEENP